MNKYWSSFVAGIKPYTPGEQPADRKFIKLNTNENPYPPSPAVIKAAREAAGEDLRLYPQPECEDLRDRLAQYEGLKRSNIYISNGSDEMLAFAFLAFFKKNEPIYFPEFTYSFYESYCALFGIRYVKVPLGEDFCIDVGEYCSQAPRGGIIFPNPNAPTAVMMPGKDICRILEANPETVTIIDEAYVDFAGTGQESASMAGKVEEYPNLLVIKTFSKSHSLAGMRIGYAAGGGHLIEALARIKNSFNSYVADRVSLAAAEAAVADSVYYRGIRERIIKTRERVIPVFRGLGFKVTESGANFIFVSHKDIRGREFYDLLRERGILVRHFDKPGIEDHLRITIGSDGEMDILIDKIHEILEKKKGGM
ncbi:MAG: histidinol-phosphate transaminase [Eubacteriales bacterium]|nr:histidinol-phosphate transaminase [Eubacteriales bacterium]